MDSPNSVGKLDVFLDWMFGLRAVQLDAGNYLRGKRRKKPNLVALWNKTASSKQIK